MNKTKKTAGRLLGMLALVMLAIASFTLTSCDDDDDVVSINKQWFTTAGAYFDDSEADLYYQYVLIDFTNPTEITVGISLTAKGVKEIEEESGLKLQAGVFYKEESMEASVTLNPDGTSGTITSEGAEVPFKNLTAKSVTLTLNDGDTPRNLTLIASKKKIAMVEIPETAEDK